MPPTIVLANDPQAYRDALTFAFTTCCPEGTVVAVTPTALDVAIATHHPDVVICSTLTEIVETRVPVWVLLYPDGARLAVTSVRGIRTTSPDVALDDLVALIRCAAAADRVLP